MLTRAPSPDELEVDVLERRPEHLELLELATCRERLRRELVEHPRRLARLDDDALAVAPEADLDRPPSPISSAGDP